MVLLKKIVNWLIWLMMMPLITFILSFVFDFAYWDVVHTLGYRFLYGITSVIFTMVYVVISDSDESLNFFR